MATKKWTAQQNEYLSQILDLLKAYDTVANLEQPEYKGDFFKIFSGAYRSGFCNRGYRYDEERTKYVQCKSQRPLVTGDAIWFYAKKQKWVHAEMTIEELRYEHVQTVQTWWDEWTYAWNHFPPPRKYTRRRPALN